MHSKKFKNFMAKLYGFGASIVILGAMFKILHLPGAGLMLGIGLTTEAIIFFFSAFEKPHEEPDWSLVYPELAGMDAHSTDKKKGGSVSQELDKLMEEAKIGPDLIESLGTGLRSFGDKVSSISNVADAAAHTTEFADKVKSASKSVEQLSSAYSQASNTLSEISNSAGDAKQYHEQVQLLAKNLSSLNAIYELELQDSNNHLKTLNKFYGSIGETMQQFNDSLGDARLYKEEVAKLAKNLSSLNAVYGNMLSAMSVPRA